MEVSAEGAATQTPAQSVSVPMQPRRKWGPLLREWGVALIWIAPALFFAGVYLVYPVFNTILLSFQNETSTSFVGWKNYQTVFSSPTLVEVLRNNALWLVIGTILTVFLGLIIAVLVDRVRLESLAKAAIFIPMAISFVGAGVIWDLVYYYAPIGQAQTGLIDAILVRIGLQPQDWLVTTTLDNFALILVYIWIWTGFCMVIISAALKSIPTEIIEAARIDGAGEVSIFFRITIPMISSTLTVVATTMVIYLLKIFDVVYVMTGGNFHTSVIAVAYYQELFSFQNYGVASALAVILLVAVIPIMYLNIRRFRAEAQR
ncbi:MAG TPA: sugar ABC transporter permease [Ktedonobacterales bacterium]|nr:sugar ABC transporter permease [Ktedonobacterales bacterium]